MIKKYKFLFLILFGLFVFLPKDTFALEGYYTNYYSDLQYNNNNLSSVITGYYGLELSSSEYYFYYSNPKNPYPGWDKISQVVIGVYSDIGNGLRDLNQSGISYLEFINSGLTIRLLTTINGQTSGSYCTFTENSGNYYLLTCPVPTASTDLLGFRVQYDDLTLGNNLLTSPVIGFSRDINFYTHDATQETIEESTDKLLESQEATQDAIKESTEATKEQTETLKDKDTSESQSEASGFFDDFESDDFGLSDIITMPLSFIQGLSSSTCYSLNLPLPFVDTNVSLPCMTSIYQRYFGSFLTLYQTITTGIIAYWCCINIFRMVQGFKNPDSDEIEVMDL